MKLLGIDYGKRKIGLAMADSDSKISAPYDVLKYKKEELVLNKIKDICQNEKIEKIIIGLPLSDEGEPTESSLSAEVFGKKLGEKIDLPIEFISEAFSSSQARMDRQSMIDSLGGDNIGGMGDEYLDSHSAAIILDNYLSDNF